MSVEFTRAASGRWPAIGGWVLKGLLALAFLAAAAMKLTSQPHMVEEFGKLGLGQGFHYFTGALEVVAIALLLWPRASFFGALILLGVCGGAFIAQVGPLHGDLIHVFVLGGLAALAAWLARPGGKARS